MAITAPDNSKSYVKSRPLSRGRLPAWTQFRFCRRCSAAITIWPRGAPARFCGDCNEIKARAYRQKRPLALKAHAIVANAVETGVLPPVRSFMCVDCGQYRAQCYDHRDYTKPLEVEPVCGGCNVRRGPGYPYNTAAA